MAVLVGAALGDGRDDTAALALTPLALGDALGAADAETPPLALAPGDTESVADAALLALAQPDAETDPLAPLVALAHADTDAVADARGDADGHADPPVGDPVGERVEETLVVRERVTDGLPVGEREMVAHAVDDAHAVCEREMLLHAVDDAQAVCDRVADTQEDAERERVPDGDVEGLKEAITHVELDSRQEPLAQSASLEHEPAALALPPRRRTGAASAHARSAKTVHRCMFRRNQRMRALHARCRQRAAFSALTNW